MNAAGFEPAWRRLGIRLPVLATAFYIPPHVHKNYLTISNEPCSVEEDFYAMFLI